MIKILLAEDHKILRDGIKSLLKDEPDIAVVGEARNGKEAIDILSETDVNVAILDINMPVMGGLETAQYIKDNFGDTKTLILSMMDDENYLLKGFEAGAKGYLLKTTGRDELLFAINKVASGECYVCSELACTLMDRVRENISSEFEENEPIDFSDREMQVLELMAEGMTNAEIADKICASRRTVETHRKNLIEKTSSKNTAALIKFVIKRRIIKC
jgi:DNA-binding NarL/FixJ family response regulator